MNKMPKAKIVFVASLFLFLFGIIIARSIKIQIFERSKLEVYSKNQSVRKIKIFPNRGGIYDRSGNPLAININTYNVFAIPREKSNLTKSIRELAKHIKINDQSKIIKNIKKRGKFTWIVRKKSLDKETVKMIKDIEDIYVEKVPSRIYPNKSLFAQGLGFVGIDNVGLAGLEYYYNDFLKGDSRIIEYVKDAKGRPLKFEMPLVNTESKDLYLSLDKDIQAVAEKYIKQVVIENKAKGAGIGVMDVKTGEILAMANYPSFDPNRYGQSGVKSRKLSFISDPFEPGSIFKAVTIISALEEKIVGPTTNYFCEYGKMKVENHYITEAESSEKFEWLSVSDILKYSSNVGTTKIAFDLTYSRLQKTLEKLDLGIRTGIELPGESRGIVNFSDYISPLELSNLSFGQGIAVTGIQMLSLYAAIANDGVKVSPTIISRERMKDSIKLEAKERVRVFSKETSHKVQKMLYNVVDGGTGRRAQIKHFKVAGKTTTAQKISETGAYDQYISGFIGFPLEVKRPFVLFVYVDEPNVKNYYGGKLAAPIFKEVAEYILYKNKEYESLAINEQNSERKDGIKLSTSSVDKVNLQKTPMLLKLDKKSLLRVAEKYDIKIRIKGSGLVSFQSPNPGEPIPKNRQLQVFLKAPSLDN